MKTFLLHHMRMLIVGVFSLFLIIVFAACDSSSIITNSNGQGTASITGSVVSVNTSAHSVVINANGQQLTITGMTDQQLLALQSQIGKTYTIQVGQTQSSNNTYTINSGSEPQELNDETPAVNQTTNAPVTGVTSSIQFTGKVLSANNNTIAVSAPNNQTLNLNLTAQTDRSDFGTGLPGAGQLIKVEVLANPDGSYITEKIDFANSGDLQDQNTVEYTGVTTSAVGANGTLSFKVGNKNLTFTIGPTTQIEDFASAQAIGSNQPVKVEVLYNGSAATVLKVQSSNN